MFCGTIWPRSFARPPLIDCADSYFGDASARKLADFFWTKGLAALKEEDRREVWYSDWLAYQAEHGLYASVLSPRQYSTKGNQFDLLKLTRFLEVFAYFSPSHGYSLQVSFLGLFSILMGSNEDLKHEAVAAIEAGGLAALGVSEKEHGSDLLANEFSVTQVSEGSANFLANGGKYYIGNSNCAAIVSILAKKLRPEDAASPARQRRSPFLLMALRPQKSLGYRNIRKIRTLGVRAAYVGEFQVTDHPTPATDFIAEGRTAWDAVFGTVTLGKFFLGFGSIGMCEHAAEEVIAHLRRRVLYRKSVLEMSHIHLAAAQAFARLTAMKLYAYRALDYVHAAGETDRRYVLFCAVQKARVGAEGVKMMTQLSDCIGAKGLESDTFFETALRDTQLIPGLEGSTHINLRLTTQFVNQYFQLRPPQAAVDPPKLKSLARGDAPSRENAYLMRAAGGALTDIVFDHFLDAYRPLKAIPNIRRFARQAQAFARLVRARAKNPIIPVDGEALDLRVTQSLGQCMATIAYAQLIAENAVIFSVPVPIVSAIFHLLVADLSAAGATLAALPELEKPMRALARQLIAVPRTPASDWDAVLDRFNSMEGG
jgi:acyl-CoA dehydrogenase